ncbi:MAG: hypothetical protein U1D30_23175 [Planctomycetota bacterium]
MQLRYFVIDKDGRLHKAYRATIERIWSGHRPASHLRCQLSDTLRIVTTLCDDNLVPQVVFLLRLALSEGRVTDAARQMAYMTVTSVMAKNGEDSEKSAFEYQVAGWPRDWQSQLAVALDTPVDALDRIAIGGPLPVSDLMGVSVKDSLQFFLRVING